MKKLFRKNLGNGRSLKGGVVLSDEQWKRIVDFDYYMISDHGRVRADRTDRILSLSENQYGVVNVGLVRGGIQHHRSVPLLVARAFIPRKFGAFDTPINLDGDRWNNHVDNLVWRPRWFAIKYNQQFKYPCGCSIELPLQDTKTGEITANSFECSKRYGLLEESLIEAILNRTYVWPTYQQFRVIEE